MNAYLRAARGGFTWRRVLLTQLLAQAIVIFTGLDEGFYGESISHTSFDFVNMSAYVFVLVPMAFCAEEAISRGARPIVVYAIMLLFINQIVALMVTLVVQWVYSIVFAFPWPQSLWGFTEAAGRMSVSCSLALLVYMNGRAADRMLEGVRSSELRRVQLDRQLVESRLATAEAQIDPRMLFSALAQIKRGLDESQPDAETKLNDLIQELRSALMRTAAASSENHHA